jgi:hypothetical protein
VPTRGTRSVSAARTNAVSRRTNADYFAGTADSSFQFVRIVVAWQYVFVQLGPLRHARTSRQAALAVPPCVGTFSTHFPE